MTCLSPKFMGTKGMIVPCGRCIPCKVRRSSEMAMRCVHEMDSYTDNVFLTLTYDDDNLPIDCKVSKRDLQLFIKRLRKQLEPRRIKYYACGEYGEKDNRPHYHLILFNVGIGDFKPFTLNGKIYYKSDCWDYGLIHLGEVNYRSARYVAKYMYKQLLGNNDDYRQPFRLMSNGLGKSFVRKHAIQLSNNMGIRFNGVDVALPRYYSKLLGINFFQKVFKIHDDFESKYTKWVKHHRLINKEAFYRYKTKRNKRKFNEFIAKQTLKECVL